LKTKEQILSQEKFELLAVAETSREGEAIEKNYQEKLKELGADSRKAAAQAIEDRKKLEEDA